jgi:hypothetical protein
MSLLLELTSETKGVMAIFDIVGMVGGKFGSCTRTICMPILEMMMRLSSLSLLQPIWTD